MRFPEFSEEWKQYKVCDVLDFYSTNSLSWEQLDFGEQTLLNLHYGLIHVGLPTLVNLKKVTLPGIKKGFVPSHYELCKSGDVAFADASEDTNDVGKAIEFIDTDNKNVVCGLHTIHGRDNKGITVNGFKGFAFASIAFHHQIRRIAQGTKIFSISTKNFSECSIGIPSKIEQEKIAKLLSLVDERLITQSRAIEKLQSLMVEIAKSLTGHSPNTKISDCLVCHNSVLQESQVAEFGTYPVYGANGVCGYTDVPLINEDSILIVKDGSGVGKVSFATGKFSVVGTSNYLTAKEGYSLRYLYYCLMCFNFTSYKTGMAIPHIYFKDYGKARIYCPSFEEQERIANALFKIETKIGIEQSLFEQFSLQKQFLLREMFI